MTAKFFDGKEVKTYGGITNVQLLERTTDGSVYVITTTEGKRMTVYADLIFCEVVEGV